MNWFKRHKKFTIFLLLTVLFLGWRRYDRQFTPRRWAETDVDRRGKLVNSLLKQYDLVGMTQAEVEELLGADTEGTQIAEKLLPDGSSKKIPMLCYEIGGRSWTGFPEFLFLYLEDGRVVETQIFTD